MIIDTIAKIQLLTKITVNKLSVQHSISSPFHHNLMKRTDSIINKKVGPQILKGTSNFS